MIDFSSLDAYFAPAPEQVKQLRAAVKAEFKSRDVKPLKQKAAGFGKR
jgi:hypothetical protein